MSRTVKGSTARAEPEQSAMMAETIRRRGRRDRKKRSECNFICCCCVMDWCEASPGLRASASGDQADDVVKDRHHHQGHQDADAGTLCQLTETLGHGAPGQNFQRIIQQKP